MAEPALPPAEASRARTIGAGPIVLAALAVPLWAEFRVPGNLAWNGFLAAFLIGLGVAAFVAQRYFRAHAGEIGEARFDTSEDGNG